MSTKKELQRIKSALAKRPNGPGRRIPPEVRRWIARYGRRRAREGASQLRIAKEIGVGEQTLSRVLNAERAEELRPIRIVKESTAVPIVRGPGGLTIEGLDVEGLATLIRALS